MKKSLNEEINRMKKLFDFDFDYDKHIIKENVSSHVEKIKDKLSGDLPLNEYSSAIDSITLLQKTLVAMGHLNKSYGLDGDGVDGDFGGDTKKGLTSAIGEKELNTGNMDKFTTEMQENQSKLVKTFDNWVTFYKKFEEQGGVKLADINTCKGKTTFKDKKWVPSKATCHKITDVAKALNQTMSEYGIVEKSSVLSVMIKEQGKGTHICALNNNYAGIQTDAGSWGGLGELITSQFCKKDDERLRAFASFDDLVNGVTFISNSFKNKGWFNKIDEINDKEVDVESIDLEGVAGKNADVWQTDWNLKLDADSYKFFKTYGYNSKLKNTTFTNKKGIYTKSVDKLDKDELTKHKSAIGTYRSPEKIKNSWDSMSKYFKMAFNIFKEIDNNA
jgi:hypothetical protein